eukprot:1147250-Pelagomonas_calceolata.AAC.8
MRHEFFNSVSAQNESMDAFMNGLPSLRAGDGGMSVNGMQYPCAPKSGSKARKTAHHLRDWDVKACQSVCDVKDAHRLLTGKYL